MTAHITKHTLSRQLLTQIFDQPGIISAIQALDPPVLAKLVRHVGLEDAGELVALASPEQLVEVFDEDLWKREQSGDEEKFDSERFVLWLEVLLDCGANIATRQVIQMDEDLLTLVLCREVFVIDIEELARRMSSRANFEDENEPLVKEVEGCLSQEFEQYAVLARNHRTWEPIRSLLVELDASQPDMFLRLLERCCYISAEYIEDNGGLYDVLTSDEMVEVDIAAGREERRTKRGYVAPSAAVSFLSHARVEPFEALLQSKTVDPMTHAYFRDAGAPSLRPNPASATPASTPLLNLLQTLREAEVIAPSPTAGLLGAGDGDTSSDVPLVAAVRLLKLQSDSAHRTRLDELAYLSNTLLAGCAFRGREMRPVEAAQAVLSTCNLGAEMLLPNHKQGATPARIARLLESETLVKLFRLGWRALNDQVVIPSAQQACLLLEQAPVQGRRQKAVAAIHRELKSGKPWRAIPAVGHLTASIGEANEQRLRALMLELPLREPDVKRGELGLIANNAQLEEVRTFLASLGTAKPPRTRRATPAR